MWQKICAFKNVLTLQYVLSQIGVHAFLFDVLHLLAGTIQDVIAINDSAGELPPRNIPELIESSDAVYLTEPS